VSGAGRRARLAIGSRVLLAAVLAVAGALLAIDLADWRYVRVDVSTARRNSLDDTLQDVLARLPGPVTVDVFFRPLQPPYDLVSAEAQGRMLELLSVVHNARRNELDLRVHDLTRLEEAQARQAELGVEGVNLVVYAAGGRKAVQELFGEIAVVDWGSPTQADARYLNELGLLDEVDLRAWNPMRPRAAELVSFQGEEALAEGLLKVSSGASPHAYLTVGSGEPGIGAQTGALTVLEATLEGDGFEVATWNPLESPAIPADAAVIACIGARQPFPQGTIERLGEWVRSGGALLAAASRAALSTSSPATGWSPSAGSCARRSSARAASASTATRAARSCRSTRAGSRRATRSPRCCASAAGACSSWARPPSGAGRPRACS
jgi:hypothetical protein